ncbi:MAG: pyridoxamine 5'-phosphate oxidase family protein [Candidatus Dormibacteria bacterium]
MNQKALDYIRQNQAAAMITLREDGSPHAVRVGIAVVDGKIWSSGTADRMRTRHLRRDPRATLFVFPQTAGPAGYGGLGVDAEVTILEGPDAPHLNLTLFRAMQRLAPDADTISWFGAEKTPGEFLATMVEEKRLVYEFTPTRTYGMF